MKELFFKGVVIAIPVIAVGGLIYMMYHGLSTLYHDMQLKKELEQIARESRKRRQAENRPDERSSGP